MNPHDKQAPHQPPSAEFTYTKYEVYKVTSDKWQKKHHHDSSKTKKYQYFFLPLSLIIVYIQPFPPSIHPTARDDAYVTKPVAKQGRGSAYRAQFNPLSRYLRR